MRLHFLTHTFKNSSGCKHPVIDVYDGSSSKTSLLYSFCDGVRPGDVISSGNAVFVSYAPPDPTAYAMFRITYTETYPQPGMVNNYDNYYNI